MAYALGDKNLNRVSRQMLDGNGTQYETLSAGASSRALSEAPEELVVLDKVRKSFGGKVALKDISFTVPAGQICGLLGPNGAGKTTLFRLMMGILKATEGKLTVGGLDAFEERVSVKRLIGFLPDEPVFYSYLSGREVLELSAAMHGLEAASAIERLMPMVRKLRLIDDIDNYAEDYSEPLAVTAYRKSFSGENAMRRGMPSSKEFSSRMLHSESAPSRLRIA